MLINETPICTSVFEKYVFYKEKAYINDIEGQKKHKQATRRGETFDVLKLIRFELYQMYIFLLKKLCQS